MQTTKIKISSKAWKMYWITGILLKEKANGFLKTDRN